MAELKEILKWAPFPTELLPSPIEEFITEGSRALNTDPAYLAVPVLAACAGSIGNARRVQLKSTWSEPAVLWAAVVAESGSGKSPALNMAMAPCERLDCEAHERQQSAGEKYQMAAERYKHAKAVWKKNGAVGDPPLRPSFPQAERLLVHDTTIEALVKILDGSPRGVMVSADELAGWFRSIRYGRSGHASWLNLYSSGSLTIDRKSGNPPTMCIPLATASIIGGVQPAILSKLMTAEYRTAGLIARFLFVRPPRDKRKWSSYEVPELVEKDYATLIRGLRSLQLDVDNAGKDAPKGVTLSADAERLYADFIDSHGYQQQQLTSSLEAAWSKLAGYAARFALVFQCIQEVFENWESPKPIEASTMQAAISLTQWFADETKRIYAEADGLSFGREMSELLDYVDSRAGSVTVRQLTRGPQRYRGNAALAKHDLNLLVKHGFGRWDAQVPTESGGRPSEVFCRFASGDVTEPGNIAGSSALLQESTVAGDQRQDAA